VRVYPFPAAEDWERGVGSRFSGENLNLKLQEKLVPTGENSGRNADIVEQNADSPGIFAQQMRQLVDFLDKPGASA
jgi:hypothetical protein